MFMIRQYTFTKLQLDFNLTSSNCTTFNHFGFPYYELGSKTANIVTSATLVLRLYEGLNPSFSWQYYAINNIIGSRCKNIKTIIYSTYKNRLHFSLDMVKKQIYYLEYNKGAANKVEQNEFCEEADVIYSSYISSVNFYVFKLGN